MGDSMACTLHLAWDDRLTGYDFGPGHPLAPVRVELTIELARAFGLLGEPAVAGEQPAPATEAGLELVHDPRYIDAVRRAGGGPAGGGPRGGGQGFGGPAGGGPGGGGPGGDGPGGGGPTHGGSSGGAPGEPLPGGWRPDVSLLRFGL